MMFLTSNSTSPNVSGVYQPLPVKTFSSCCWISIWPASFMSVSICVMNLAPVHSFGQRTGPPLFPACRRPTGRLTLKKNIETFHVVWLSPALLFFTTKYTKQGSAGIKKSRLIRRLFKQLTHCRRNITCAVYDVIRPVQQFPDRSGEAFLVPELLKESQRL